PEPSPCARRGTGGAGRSAAGRTARGPRVHPRRCLPWKVGNRRSRLRTGPGRTTLKLGLPSSILPFDLLCQKTNPFWLLALWSAAVPAALASFFFHSKERK